MKIQTKRVYDAPDPGDGERYLVDGLWPRGVSKEKACLTAWLKEVAPSPTLRKWFNHDPARWDGFQRRYFAELNRTPQAASPLRTAVREGKVTLLFGAKDRDHNNAVVLKNWLENQVKHR